MLTACNQEEFVQQKVEHIHITPSQESSPLQGTSENAVPVGNEMSLNAIGVFNTGSVEDVSDSVSWKSNKPMVATIDAKGKVTGLSEGEVLIYAEKDGINAQYKILVTGALLKDITITPPLVSLANGTSKQLKAKGIYSDGNTQEITDTVAWISQTDGIVTISNEGKVTALKSGTTEIIAKKDDIISSNHISVTISAGNLVNINITPQTSTLPIGTTTQLDAIGTYSDNSTLNLNDDVVWSSDDTAIATVSQSGEIKALSEGVASIEVLSKSTGLSNVSPAMINVVKATLTDIQLSPASAELPLGYTMSVQAQGYYDDMSQSDITSQIEKWTSSDPLVASVDDKGVVTAVSAGNAEIYGKIGSVKSSNFVAVKVSPETLASIELTPLSLSVAVGEFERITATATFQSGKIMDVSSSVAWASDDSNIAMVDSIGLVYGISQGQSAISAELDGIKSTVAAKVDVTAGSITEIILPQEVDVVNGEQIQLNATGLFSDGTSRDITGEVSWISSNESIATIDEHGVLEGHAVGTASIVASLNGVSNSIESKVNVLDASLLDIKLTVSNDSIAAGYTTQASATGVYSDGSELALLPGNVYWLSDDPDTATVNSDGLVKAVTPGLANIVATTSGVTSSKKLAINVTAAELEKLYVESDKIQIPLELQSAMTVNGEFSDGSLSKIDNHDVIWSSEDNNIATVDSAGIVTGVSKANVNIVAEKSGVKGLINIEVLDKSIVDIKIEYHTWKRGEKEYVVAFNDNHQPRQLYAKYIYSDGSEQRVKSDDLRWLWVDGNTNSSLNDAHMIDINKYGYISLNTSDQSAWADIVAIDEMNNITSSMERFTAAEVTFDTAKCDGLNKGYDVQSSTDCLSLFTAGEYWITSPPSVPFANAYSIGYTSNSQGLMPDGNDSVVMKGDQKEEMCSKLNDIKAFGIDYWVEDNNSFTFEYEELFKEHGSLSGVWPLTLNASGADKPIYVSNSYQDCAPPGHPQYPLCETRYSGYTVDGSTSNSSGLTSGAFYLSCVAKPNFN